MTERFDVAIVGSGFGGSLTAMIARRLGKSVVLLEKGRHPRFAIGESSTPLANLMLENLAQEARLPALLPLTKWGTWQQTYPRIACGLKRGFSFFHHDLHRPAPVMSSRHRQLLVAASPHDAIADTHWYRPDFDHFLVQQAVQLGVDYREGVRLEGATEGARSMTLHGDGLAIEAELVVDASGPRGFLHHALGLPELPLPGYPQTVARFAHFTGVAPLPAPDGDPPYPPDAAAVHHLFPGGWVWVLQFNNGITSAGMASVQPMPDWDDLLRQIPDLGLQFAASTRTTPWMEARPLPFRSRQIAAPHWALLPSAAGFVDPLLSTGFPLTLLGIERLFKLSREEYAEQTQGDLLAAADLIGALYSAFGEPEAFRKIILLYFAAVSYAETAWRLGKRHLADSFLLREHPVFGPASRALLQSARQSKQPIDSENLIRQFDIAGLCNPNANGWYGVDAADLLRNRHLVQASTPEIETLLERSGWNAPNQEAPNPFSTTSR